METKANHRAVVVKLGAPRVHTNADTLEIFDVMDGAYQVVTKKGNFKEGDLGVYIQPDSVVPQTMPFEFIWGPYSTKKAEPGLGTTYSDVPEKRRRITVKRIRKEWSEGLLMPVSDFISLPEQNAMWEGDDVAERIGITHYNPDQDEEEGTTLFAPKKRRRLPRSFKGWFFFLLHKLFIYRPNGNHHGYDTEDGVNVPTYDVESLKNFQNVLQDGENVVVTEKIHGSNGRFVFLNGHMYAGSRNQWKAPDSTCVWRRVLVDQPWIEQWCKANEGYVLYGEVTPTQGGYEYGSDRAQFFVFDILTPKGEWVDKQTALSEPEIITVPLLFTGAYRADLSGYTSGPSTVQYAQNIREGIVITAVDQRKVRGLGRIQLKLVSNSFLEKDSK